MAEVYETVHVHVYIHFHISQYRRGFYHECPSGELSKQKLQDMYGLLLPPGIARVFVEQLFGLFDSDKSGSIDFNVKYHLH